MSQDQTQQSKESKKEEGESIQDRLAPTSSKEDAQIEPLSLITLSTSSLEEIRSFYVDGLGLTLNGPYTESLPSALYDHYPLKDQNHKSLKGELYSLTRPTVSSCIPIMLWVWPESSFPSSIHQSWNALELGPFSIGFPNLDQTRLDQKMRKMGIQGLNEMEVYSLQRPDGSEYTIKETIFNGPDYVHAVGIERCDGMPPLGEVDLQTGMGGPAYSAQMIRNTEASLSFYTQLLGLELRAGWVWESAGTEGALNVPDGTTFKFSLVYAPGARSGHLLFVEYLNQTEIEPLSPPRLPSLGMGMWSFEVKDLTHLLRCADEAQYPLFRPPLSYTHPLLGLIESALFLDPDGFLIEVYQLISKP